MSASILSKVDGDKLLLCGEEAKDNANPPSKCASPKQNKKKELTANFVDANGKKIHGITEECIVFLQIQWKNISQALIKLNKSDDLIFALKNKKEVDTQKEDYVKIDETKVEFEVKFKS
jgi:hypothetical protein